MRDCKGNPAQSHRRVNRGGYLLVEVLLSLVIMSIVLTAMGSVIIMATRAMNLDQGSGVAVVSTRSAMDQMLADIRLATSIPVLPTATSATLIVPDFNGDGEDDSVTYAWSGTSGGSGVPPCTITRSVNGSAPVAIASGVRNFNLSFATRTVGPPPPPPAVESSEQELKSHDNAPGGAFSDSSVDKSSWCATYFKPTLPANTLAWKITRVKIFVKCVLPATETLQIQIRTANASLQPTAIVLGSTNVPETSLPAISGWVDVDFTPVSNLNPANGYCLVVTQTNSAGTAAKVQYESNGNPMTANAHWMTTGNSGSSWSNADNKKDMRFFVYGTISTQQ